MKRVRNRVAVLAGRLTNATMRMSGKKSTALPGYVTETVGDAPLAEVMRRRSYAARIVITGTNGKTTTTLFIKNILEAAGYSVVNNGSGSNLSRGVITALLQDRRQGDQTVLVLEVDEASMPAVVAAVQPSQIVITNIFRDQLDRYGEVDYTRRLLERAIKLAPSAELILNADDPHVARLAQAVTKARYFGLELTGVKALKHDHASDVPLSPNTGSPLVYSRRYFGHVGIYRAKDRSFVRPRPDIAVTKIIQTASGQRLSLKLGDESTQLELGQRGLYSAYNVAAALVCAKSLGLDRDAGLEAIRTTKAAFGRQEELVFQGAHCSFYLVKNPTGFNQVIQANLQKDVRAPILIVINDNFADGRDVSWLWDVAIEDIDPRAEIIVAGKRAYDMALRVTYAGKTCRVIEDPLKAMRSLAQQHQAIIILPTYTALLQIRKELKLALEHQK